ncbi:MAG: AzlC family ABC transporter permease [Eubacterium sp.]|nr:AzlC family ABC transporter permease [Eubacterium sp.]
MKEFRRGVSKGIPIALGYLSVSFTFGVKAVHGGLPVWVAVLISLTNLTSAGQLAGLELILAGGSYLEIGLSTLIINLRYMLMSLSLTQRMEEGVKTSSKMFMAHGVTDEIFAVAITDPKKITGKFMFGLMLTPILGWVSGTFLGAVASQIMPAALGNAMELGLYAMFISIIIPPAKKNKKLAAVVVFAIAISCLLYYLPVFRFISAGFKIIIATFLAAGLAASFLPVDRPDSQEVTP